MDPKVREIFEKVKIGASMAVEAAGKAADAAGKAAEGVVETTKLNLQIFDLNTEIELQYKEIGKLVYATHNGEDVTAEEVDEKLSLIDEKLAQIKAMKEKMAEKKADVKCPVCGRNCDKDDVYCRFCGTRFGE